MVKGAVMVGSAEPGWIRSAPRTGTWIAKLMVSAAGVALAALMAWRKVQLLPQFAPPVSAVLVTTKVAAKPPLAAMSSTVTKTTRAPASTHRFIRLPPPMLSSTI